MKKQQRKPTRFIRVRGRIVPIFKKEARNLKNIVKKSNSSGATGKIAGATALSFGGLFAAGRLQRASLASTGKKSSRFLRGAKLLKFGSKIIPGSFIAGTILALDRSTKADEKSKLFDLSGTQASTGRVLIGAAAAYASIRLGKRFEKFGLRGGKFPFKLKDI